MPIKYKYALFILIIHTLLAGLIFYVFKDALWYFLGSEVILLGSLYLSYKIYRSLIKPIELMQTGVNAIKEEDYNVRFLKTGSKEMNGLITVFNTMLDKLGEERIRTQEQAYVLESLIEASPIGMITLDFDDNIANINPKAKDILAPSKAQIGSPVTNIDHELIRKITPWDIGTSEIVSINGIHKYRCQIRRIIHRGFPRKFILIEELSIEFLENEKQAYDKVIRMMAHEVNNSMGAVNSILQTVNEYGLHQEEDEEYRESLDAAIQRNTDLATFIKRYAEVIRVPTPLLKKTSLKTLVEHCLSIMSGTITESDIFIDHQNMSEVAVYIDNVLIEQVVVNILKNAIESIGQQGQITITTSPEKPQLIITDNGSGISEADAEMLFTPFYSTKPTGQGVGLMLTREILMRHGATFKLYTDPKTALTHFEISFREKERSPLTIDPYQGKLKPK